MKEDSDHHGQDRDQKRVSKGVPEVRDFHRLGKVAEAPFGREGKRSRNIVCHFRRLFKGNDHCHVQREENCDTSDDQQNGNRPVGSADPMTFLFHHNCSSFLFINESWNPEIATITTKNSTALALWKPNCPPSIPFL